GDGERRGAFLDGEVADDPADHVADVGEALAQVFVGDLREQGGVLGQRLVEGGDGVLAFAADAVVDLADQGGVAEQGPVGAEDGSLVLADGSGDTGDDAVEFGG